MKNDIFHESLTLEIYLFEKHRYFEKLRTNYNCATQFDLKLTLCLICQIFTKFKGIRMDNFIDQIHFLDLVSMLESNLVHSKLGMATESDEAGYTIPWPGFLVTVPDPNLRRVHE